MKKISIVIVVIIILVIAVGAVLFFTTDVLDGIINKDDNSQPSATSSDNTTIDVTNTDNWKTYESTAGFSFKHPSDFLEQDLDALFGLHSPEDNTDDVNLVMPQECYDKTVELFDINSNLNVNDDTTQLEYFGEQCVTLDVSKKTKEFYKELDFWTNSNTNTTGEEREEYSFAGLTGNLISSVEKVEGVDNYDYELTGDSGDYIFKIKINGYGMSQTDIFSIFTGVAQSMEIDSSLLVEADPYADTDEDGIMDEYEEYYGTDPKIADTDGDGYSDGEEINGCYNPLGEGMMTGEYFKNYCVAEISASSLVTTSTFDNREALCTAWKPIAEDFINGTIDNILLFKEWYADYPEICEKIDTLMGKEFCSQVDLYLNWMCPEKDK